jgi:hypothetical protein
LPVERYIVFERKKQFKIGKYGLQPLSFLEILEADLPQTTVVT